MGKKIDGFVLSVVTAAGLYLYFYRSIENHTAALAMSAVCFLLLSKLLRRTLAHLQNSKWHMKHRIRKHCGSTIMHLACTDHETAKIQVASLIEKCYGPAQNMALVQQHPASTLSVQHIFEIWKSHQGEQELVICATCAADSACSMLCNTLKQPRIALLDANALSHLVSEHPEGIYMEAPPSVRCRLRLKRLSALLFNRKNAPRCLLFSAALLGLHLLSANPWQLFASMALLFLALASLRKTGRPAKLF